MEQKPSLSLAEAIAKLEYYCAYQERCRAEVSKKLISLSVSPDISTAVLAHVIKENFLNESRFALIFARGKFRLKFWSRYKITTELKARHISEKDIQEALKEINGPVYLKALHTLARKWWSQNTEKDLSRKKPKLAAYLIARGWESDLVHDMLREIRL